MKKYNYLNIINIYKKNNRKYARCKCRCGTICSIRYDRVLSGYTKSCGCYQTEQRRLNVEIGKNYGRLTILSVLPWKFPYSRDLVVNCLCDCGKTINSRISNIKSGLVSSCGCLQLETQKKNGCLRGPLNYKHGLSRTPEYRSAYSAHRRETESLMGSIWNARMNKYLRVLQPMCILCGAVDDLTTDHVNPLRLGFRLEPGNAITLCRKCNSRKGGKAMKDIPYNERLLIRESANDFEDAWISSGLEISR